MVYSLEGTAQDCVNHMRRAHDIPPLAKAATETREQWYSMSRPAISGIAVDTLLFSRIGVPLFHRYRVFDRQGTHGALRGTYMRRMHTFRRPYVGIIVDVLGTLQLGCRGHLF